MVDMDVNGTAFASNTLDTLGYASNDTVYIAYQPDGLGAQTLTYLLSADAEDENPGNNTATQSFEVTDLQYGRDNGVITAAFPGDGTDDYIAMPLYDIVNDVTIYAIDVAILDGSEDGTPIRGFLVDMFDDLALTEQYGGELISSLRKWTWLLATPIVATATLCGTRLLWKSPTKPLLVTGSALHLSTTEGPTSKLERLNTRTTRPHLYTDLSEADQRTIGTTVTKFLWCV